jgi:hypothetical protein
LGCIRGGGSGPVSPGQVLGGRVCSGASGAVSTSGAEEQATSVPTISAVIPRRRRFHVMVLILLEALAALLILVLIVWWTMFSGRPGGEPPDEDK